MSCKFWIKVNHSSDNKALLYNPTFKTWEWKPHYRLNSERKFHTSVNVKRFNDFKRAYNARFRIPSPIGKRGESCYVTQLLYKCRFAFSTLNRTTLTREEITDCILRPRTDSEGNQEKHKIKSYNIQESSNILVKYWLL